MGRLETELQAEWAAEEAAAAEATEAAEGEVEAEATEEVAEDPPETGVVEGYIPNENLLEDGAVEEETSEEEEEEVEIEDEDESEDSEESEEEEEEEEEEKDDTLYKLKLANDKEIEVSLEQMKKMAVAGQAVQRYQKQAEQRNKEAKEIEKGAKDVLSAIKQNPLGIWKEQLVQEFVGQGHNRVKAREAAEGALDQYLSQIIDWKLKQNEMSEDARRAQMLEEELENSRRESEALRKRQEEEASSTFMQQKEQETTEQLNSAMKEAGLDIDDPAIVAEVATKWAFGIDNQLDMTAEEAVALAIAANEQLVASAPSKKKGEFPEKAQAKTKARVIRAKSGAKKARQRRGKAPSQKPRQAEPKRYEKTTDFLQDLRKEVGNAPYYEGE